MYKSAHRGVISLIPKKGKDPMIIKNWRPLMLLNVDCKIISKMLTIRLRDYLEIVISDHQTAYMPGRFIGLNI